MTQDLIDFGGFDVAVDLDHWPAKILRALLRRHYERHEIRLVSRLLTPGDRVIELGSAIGVVALAASRIVPPERIACFDANPDMVDAARANFARNGRAIEVENKILIPEREVAGSPSETTFHVTPYFLSSSLIEHRDDMTAVQVANGSLERAIAERSATVAIIDIEGGEFSLLGAADLSGIETLILELHAGLAGVAPCLDLIADLGRQGLHMDAVHTSYNVFVFRRDAAPAAPDFAETYLTALVDADAGRPEASLTAIERAVGAAPENPYAHLFRAELLNKAARTAEALSAALHAASLDPENEDIRELIALQKSADGDLESAERSYRRAIEIAPYRPLFHAGLGTVLARQDRPADALEALRAAVALNPERANRIEQLMALMVRQDKFDASTPQACNDNHIQDIDGVALLTAIAGSVEHSFRLPDAAAALGWAITLAPDDEALQCGLAMLLAKPGDVRDAVADTR